MSKLRIPERYLPGIELLLGLQPEKAEVLSSLIDQMDPCITVDEVLNYLSDKITNLEIADLSKILEFLLSINDFRIADDCDRQDLVLKISEAIIEKKLTSNQDFQDINFVQNRLTQFLGNEGALSLISKIRSVYGEHQKVFLSSRILTDIRPIFNDDTKSIQAMLILHNLKIGYLIDDKKETFFVTIDDADIDKLISDLEKAKRKTELAKESLHMSNIQIIVNEKGD
jgi:hypothetical protein